jgi:hypothetical protein
VVHGVYSRKSPKALWQLVSVSASAETALKDKKTCLEAARKDGQAEASVAIKTFDTTWFMPETLAEIDEDTKLMYN